MKKYDNMCQHGEDSPWLRRKGHERALNFNSTVGETILQENLDMIPVVCLLWDRNGVFVVTQILNIQMQWVSGQDHKPVTATIQDHGTVCDEVRNHLSRDYKHQKNLSAYKKWTPKHVLKFGNCRFNLLELGLENHLDSNTLQSIFLQ